MAERRPRGPATFRQRDVEAAMRAVEKAGKQIAAVEIAPDGTIRVLTSTAAPVDGSEVVPEGKGWDDV